MRASGLFAALCVLVLMARCSCDPPPVPPPPPPIGEGDPIEGPDGGPDYETDAGPIVCTDDASEDNDTRSAALALTPDIPQRGTVCGDDDDWFSIQTSAGCTLIALVRDLSEETNTGDVDLVITDPNGIVVGAANTVEAIEVTDVQAEKTGLYGVRLRAGERDIVPYEVTLTTTCLADLTCPADDRLEDNDAAGATASLFESVAHDGILCGTDEDWFTVPVTVGCNVTAQVDFTNADGDIDLELYRADGTTAVAESDSTTDQERIAKGITEGGMRLRVFFFGAPAGDAANEYRLTVRETCQGELACPSDDPFEPNDDRATANDLFAPLDDVAGIKCADEDFYELTPQAGCTLNATLTFVHAAGNLDLELQNAATGAQIAISSTDTDTETLRHAATTADPVTLRVFGTGANAAKYRLHVDSSCP